MNAVIGGLELGPGDEVLTSDEEHPGLLAPLAVARERRGIAVRKVVPFEEVAGAAGPATQLIACSHVSWHTGRIADTEALAAAGPPVLLDGAQGLGAIAVDVGALGCDFYAASGQKWLCGPIGSGYLYVRSDRIEELSPISPGYGSLEDPMRALELDSREGAARFDGGLPTIQHSPGRSRRWTCWPRPGWTTCTTRGPELAARLAADLAGRGLTVAPAGTVHARLLGGGRPGGGVASGSPSEGFVVRHLPGTPYVRASVGAWSSEEELERLAATSAS